jgi:DNA polymerase III delta subunit
VPADNAFAFLRAIARDGAPPTLVALAGPQTFLREYVLDTLRIRLGRAGFLYRSFQLGMGGDAAAISDELDGGDLFAPKRFVVCRLLRAWRERGGIEDGVEDRSRGADAGSEAALIAAVERLAPALHLAIICERDTVPAKLRRVVEQRGTVINCPRPFDNQLGNYAELFARNAGLRLAPSATDLLVARHGGDLSAIANAINRAAITAREGKALEASDFGEAGAGRVPDLFELADAIARGNTNESLGLLGRAIQTGRDPIEILAVEIIPLIRRMLVAAALIARRKPPAALASAMGLPPSSTMLARAVDGARAFGIEALRAAHRRAAQLDELFKTGMVKERESAIASLLLDLMTRADRATWILR